MIRAIITDDEQPARQIVREFLADFTDIEIIAECQNGRTCVEAVNSLAPEVLFLDVQMPVLNGFEALARFEHLPLVIFSTAYDHYALRAFEVNAVDYLLKPYDKQRFAVAVNRALERCSERNVAEPQNDSYLGQLTQLLAAVRPADDYLETLMVRHGSKILAVKADDIEWIEAADDYAALHIGGAEYLAGSGISILEQRLNPRVFKRVHRSTMLNIKHLRHVEPDASGGMTATMASGATVKISRSYAAEVKKMLV